MWHKSRVTPGPVGPVGVLIQLFSGHEDGVGERGVPRKGTISSQLLRSSSSSSFSSVAATAGQFPENRKELPERVGTTGGGRQVRHRPDSLTEPSEGTTCGPMSVGVRSKDQWGLVPWTRAYVHDFVLVRVDES